MAFHKGHCGLSVIFAETQTSRFFFAPQTYAKLMEIQNMGKVVEAEKKKPDAVLSKSR